MSRWKVAIIGIPLFTAVGSIAVLALFFTSMMVSPPGGQLGTSCGPGGAGAGAAPPGASGGQRRMSLSAEQLTNARIIIRTGQGMRVPSRGQVIAIATALQESTLRNLTWGDRDSVGLFQQRPSAGWGTVAELTDPPTAARKFYQALLKVPGWTSMPLTRAAQAVQRSAFPFAYAKWETLATSLVTRAGVLASATAPCMDFASATLPSGVIGRVLAAALAQLGDPYVWGATGPDAFDCSGLVVFAWRQAGFRLAVRTAAQMSNISAPVPRGSEQPGDLYFGEFNVRVPGAGHVMIVVRPGLAVEAPSTGDVVKLFHYDVNDTAWRFGRLPSSALIPLGGAAAAA